MVESVGLRSVPLAGHGQASADARARAASPPVNTTTARQPAEPIDPNEPVGPPPTFKHTYLQRARAMFPENPVPEPSEPQPDTPVRRESLDSILVLRARDMASPPKVDIRR